MLNLVDLKWTKEPQDTRVSVGSAVEIPCESNNPGDTKVQWFRVDEDGFNNELVNFSGTLRLAPVALDHAGQYECRISDSSSKLVKRIKLDVLGK